MVYGLYAVYTSAVFIVSCFAVDTFVTYCVSLLPVFIICVSFYIPTTSGAARMRPKRSWSPLNHTC